MPSGDFHFRRSFANCMRFCNRSKHNKRTSSNIPKFEEFILETRTTFQTLFNVLLSRKQETCRTATTVNHRTCSLSSPVCSGRSAVFVCRILQSCGNAPDPSVLWYGETTFSRGICDWPVTQAQVSVDGNHCSLSITDPSSISLDYFCRGSPFSSFFKP